MPLPKYIEPYWDAINVCAKYYGLDPFIIAGIGDRETRWGTHPACKPKGPECTGDNGHGRGLMQIDDRFHSEWIKTGAWKDPRQNINYACNLLKANLASLGDLRAAVAAYNCGAGNVGKALRRGLDVDAYTTGKDYSADVLKRAEKFRK